jgi:multiple sugar transport system substrate-binding protein
MITRRNFTRLSLFGLGLGLTNCKRQSNLSNMSINIPPKPTHLTIWWEQGFLPEENEQVIQIVERWEKQSGLKVNLKFLPVELMDLQLTKLVKEPENQQIPDIVYSVGVDASLAPKLAWRDELMDLSEIIVPIQNRYTSVALSHVSYRNQVRGERSYFALPLWQAEDYIHYWDNLIQKIGFTQQDIPQKWDGFWKFWQTAQKQLRSQGKPEIYGLGLCMSPIGYDTYTSLMMFLDAHNVTLVNNEGQFLLETSDNRKRFIDALTEYTQFYLEGYVPPTAIDWTGAGNNTSFLNGDVLMTQNLTFSIPLTQQLTPNQYNQDAVTRYQQIVTIERPKKLDGTQLLTRKGIKQAIVPKACQHPEAAKDFLVYLIEPENLNQLIKGFKGRVLPVMPQLFDNSFWSNPSDAQLLKVLKIYNRPSLTPYEVIHSAFSEVQNQQLWAKTVLKIIRDKASPTKAADWAIAQIKNIFVEWDKPV